MIIMVAPVPEENTHKFFVAPPDKGSASVDEADPAVGAAERNRPTLGSCSIQSPVRPVLMWPAVLAVGADRTGSPSKK